MVGLYTGFVAASAGPQDLRKHQRLKKDTSTGILPWDATGTLRFECSGEPHVFRVSYLVSRILVSRIFSIKKKPQIRILVAFDIFDSVNRS